MIFSSLQTREENFRSKVSSLLTPVRVPIPNENLILEGQFYKPNNTRKYFFSKGFAKERIVIHHTAGSISSDIDTLTKENDNFVSVPFVIARDGTIYQLFGSSSWARHLGPGLGNQVGMNNAQDKITVGIELSNYGFLIEKDGNLETIYSRVFDKKTKKASPPQIYCSLSDTDAYQKLDIPFRGESYFATFTEHQYESLIILLRFLTTKFNIPRNFLAENTRYTQTNAVLSFKGIVSHANYRKDKWDIGNTFDWDKIIEGVQATEFVPKFSNTTNTREFLANIITSEQEIVAQLPVNEEPKNEIVKDLQDNLAQKSTKTQNLVALLVGINKYKGFPLSGCVNDMNDIKDYLEKKSGFETNILALADEKATKKAIVDSFRTHLSTATKDDTILFYYSGHGTKEAADPIWKKDSSTDGLECIVCYNGEPDFLLADKEIRYLLHELWENTQAHIVVIADCCHSGDNTRGEITKNAFTNANERRIRLAKPFPVRAWENFVFNEKISFEEAKTKASISDFLPEGNHVQIAACESDESALEVDGHGVFTKNLIKVLENSGGNINYQSLSGRIRNYMKLIYEQKPRIYSNGEKDLTKTIFLNKTLGDRGMNTEVLFNGKLGWVVNMGAVHGIEIGATVNLFDAQNTKIGQAKVSKVFIDYALIKTEVELDKNKVYRATVKALVHNLAIQLQNYDTNPNELQNIADALEKQSSGQFNFKQDGRPDYTLHFKNGRSYLTNFKDDFRPLFYPLSITSDSFNETLSQYLRDISRWHYVANLKNKNSTGILKNPLLIEVFKVNNDGSETKLDITSNVATLEFDKVGEKWKGGIKIKIKNQSPEKLYVCAAYMTARFGIDTSFLPSKVQLFEPNAELFLQFRESNIIPIFLDKDTKEYNWEKSLEYLNFIISTDIFDDSGFVQRGLPRPPVSSDKDKDRGIGDGEEEEDDKEVKMPDWQTQKLTLAYINPVYNQANQKELGAMLDFDEMNEFIVGLYYDLKKNKQLQPEFKLKPQIKVSPSEKDLLWDIKLGIANAIERGRRRRAYNAVKNIPNILKIVAEGDSWFQYPFYVKEIIDQLSPLYAICSIAAAGDTLENYMKEREYLEAIEAEKPKLYLVSGGGNDILGENFSEFIKKSTQSGLPPEQYLTAKFAVKLAKLEEWYREMFAEVSIPTIVHGYDYIYPVDVKATPKASSWAGKYMHKKGITNPTDQRNIIIYIMDKFNDLLKRLEADFAHVHYVDVRNSVPNRNDWYDEIHPNDNGFNTISIKIINKINELLNKGVIV